MMRNNECLKKCVIKVSKGVLFDIYGCTNLEVQENWIE